MGSGYDDGFKNADVFDGMDRPSSRFAPGFDSAVADGAGHGRKANGHAPSQVLIERAVEASVLTALLRRHATLHPPGTMHRPGAGRAPDAGKALPRGLTSLRGLKPSPSEIERFVALVASGDVQGALAWLTPWRHPFGLLDDRITGLLGETAQRLGRGWGNDDLCFAEVSLGLVTLQNVLHEFAPAMTEPRVSARRMLLVPMPGEVHCFGMRMLGIRFRQVDWDCDCESHMTEEALLRRVAGNRYDVVGLSAQRAEDEACAAGLIARIREASGNPHLRILLGGARFVGRPEAAMALGADLAPLPFDQLSGALDRLIPRTES